MINRSESQLYARDQQNQSLKGKPRRRRPVSKPDTEQGKVRKVEK